MDWQDQLASMGAQFGKAFEEQRAMRTLVVIAVIAFSIAMLMSSFADVTRPKIYIVRDDERTEKVNG